MSFQPTMRNTMKAFGIVLQTFPSSLASRKQVGFTLLQLRDENQGLSSRPPRSNRAAPSLLQVEQGGVKWWRYKEYQGRHPKAGGLVSSQILITPCEAMCWPIALSLHLQDTSEMLFPSETDAGFCSCEGISNWNSDMGLRWRSFVQDWGWYQLILYFKKVWNALEGCSRYLPETF